MHIDKTFKGFYIQLNTFWKQDHCFEFLTASLKLALNNRTIRGVNYFRNTEAYDKFMSGKTKIKLREYQTPFSAEAGWKDFFDCVDSECCLH